MTYLHLIRELAFTVMELGMYFAIAMMLTGALWVLVSHYWVYRQGGLHGVIAWHTHTREQYEFNDLKFSGSILALTVIGIWLCIQDVQSGLVPGLSSMLGALVAFLITGLVAERRRHWELLKSSARQVMLRHHSH